MFDVINHYTLTMISAAVTMATGVVLLMLSIPYTKEWANFRKLRSFLAATYILLSVVNFASCMVQMEHTMPWLLSCITLLIASFQAMLFTAGALVLMRSSKIHDKVVVQSTCIFVSGVVLMVSLFCFKKVFPYLFWTAIVAYVLQIAYYTFTFRKEYRFCVIRLEKFYDEIESGRLRWISRCFYSALVIGVLAFFFAAIPVSLDTYACFTMVFTMFYVYMAGCVVNYRIEAGFLVRLKEEAAPDDPVTEAVVEKKEEPEVNLTEEKDKVLRASLSSWIERKRFTIKDTNLDDIAKELGTSQRLLSAHFSKYEQVSFRTWRTKLRIDEACRLLREEDDLQLKSINELVGIGDYSYFYKQFKLATGMSPSDYREKSFHTDMAHA